MPSPQNPTAQRSNFPPPIGDLLAELSGLVAAAEAAIDRAPHLSSGGAVQRLYDFGTSTVAQLRVEMPGEAELLRRLDAITARIGALAGRGA